MSVVIPMEHDAHAAAQALLPWYARAQLSAEDAEQVQRHLLQCAACRDELAAELPLQTLLTVAGGPAAGGDVDGGVARLHARMRRARLQPGPSRWMPWALGLQGAACVLLLGLWLQARPGNEAADAGAPAYQGLSAAGSAPVVADALVMFKAGTSEQAMRELLQSSAAGIVAGPTETGAYLLRVDAQGLASLRQAGIVALAEPLQPGPQR